MTPERLEWVQKVYIPCETNENTRVVLRDLTDALESAQAKIAALESAKPVAVVQELTDKDQRESMTAWREGGASGFTEWVRSKIQSIPADRVLGEGQVAVDREELDALRDLDDVCKRSADGEWVSWSPFFERLDALSSQAKQVEG